MQEILNNARTGTKMILLLLENIWLSVIIIKDILNIGMFLSC